MIWPNLIVEHLRGTLKILDDVHAEPDELFKIGVVITRLENTIELLEEGERKEKAVMGRLTGPLLRRGSA